MSYIKNALKNARDAIGAKNYEEAIKQCENVLQFQADNYNALVFLGVAQLNLNQPDACEKSYRRAIEINDSQVLAWQGLVKFYEKQENWDALNVTLKELLVRQSERKDAKQSYETLSKLIELNQDKIKDRLGLVAALKYLLPESPYYDIIKDVEGFPKISDTLQRIADILEAEESDYIRREIDSRRKRLGAPPHSTIQAQVHTEVYTNSELEQIYERLIRLSEKSEVSINLNKVVEKYLEHLQKKIKALPLVKKVALRDKLLEEVQKSVERDVSSPLPYEILIENTDAQHLSDYDETLLKKYVEKFPNTGYSKIVRAFLRYKEGETVDEILEVNEDFDQQDTVFGHLFFSWLYHDSNDYDSALEYATAGRDIISKDAKATGFLLERQRYSLTNCYLNIDPKYHSDAFALYQDILETDKDNIQALQGLGKALSAQKKFEDAIETFERILKLDPSNHVAKSEIGWVYFAKGAYDEAQRLISEALEICPQCARYHYRLGRIYWSMDESYRTDKAFAYKSFFQAINIDQNCADAFTYLGHYYRTIEDDSARAKKCYQKAFSIDPHNDEAGLQLGAYYVKDGQAGSAEIVYRNAIQANSRAGWAWKRLGFIELAKGNYQDAIADFQKALRTDVKDVLCWEGLAEAYQREGRYTASIKAFVKAMDLDPQSLFSNYRMAYVKQKLGQFSQAINQYNITLSKAVELGDADHLPSLKGLGDSYLALAKEYFVTGFYGRAAVATNDGLHALFRAIKINQQLQCLWKLIADLCSLVRCFPNYLHLIDIRVVKNIVDNVDPTKIDESLHLSKGLDYLGLDIIRGLESKNVASSLDTLLCFLTCACVAYKYAIFLNGKDREFVGGYWHDLGITYFNMHKTLSEQPEGNDKELSTCLSMCIRCIKIALKLEPSNFNFWNALGVVSLTANAKTSQHAFIKSIEHSPKNPAPWTNLGFLYLLHSDLELANQAFSKARSLDPDWIQAWVGQAFVANLWENEEAAELFEHAFDISGGYVLEADYGFAFKTFNECLSNPARSSSLLVSPVFALEKLIEQRPDDAAALNLMGLVLERLNQPKRAAEAFSAAILALENSSEEGDDISFSRKLAYAHGNLGRVLCASENFHDAIAAYTTALNLTDQESESTEFRIYSRLGLGLSYYFANQLEDSLKMFDALRDSDDQIEVNGDVRKNVAVLLAQVLWGLGDITSDLNHLPALFGLCAIGLLQEDESLSVSSLMELRKVSLESAGKLDKEFLFSCYSLLKDSPQEATRWLSKAIHRQPANAMAWARLATHLISISCSNPTVSIAESALSLLSTTRSSLSNTFDSAQAHQNLASALLLQIGEDDIDQETVRKAKKSAIRQAQRAIFIAPSNLTGWSILGAVWQICSNE